MFTSHLSRTAAITLGALAFGAPVAAAMPAWDGVRTVYGHPHFTGSASTLDSPGDRAASNAVNSGIKAAGPSFSLSEAAQRSAGEADAMTNPPVIKTIPVVHTVHVGDGFELGDAAIGAGGALLIVAAAGGLLIAMPRRRQPAGV
jgi:hypothetical protein